MLKRIWDMLKDFTMILNATFSRARKDLDAYFNFMGSYGKRLLALLTNSPWLTLAMNILGNCKSVLDGSEVWARVIATEILYLIDPINNHSS